MPTIKKHGDSGSKISVGMLRLNIDTVKNHFMYEESDHFASLNPIYFCGRIRRIDRPLEFHREPVRMLRYHNMFVPVFSQNGLARFGAIIAKRKIKLFYAQLIYDAIPFISLINEMRLPLFINFRGGDFASVPVNFFFKKILDRTTSILTKSHFQKKFLIQRGVPQRKIKVAYGGVDVGRIPFSLRKMSSSRLKFLSAGRYIEKKGFDLTLKFFQLFSRTNPGASLTLIAEGLKPEILKKLVPDEKVLRRIRLLPYQAHEVLVQELHNHDIFILLSRRTAQNDMEGIPNVLKEAMASGMPVVSSFHSGIPELIQDGRTGLLVKEGDYAAVPGKIRFICDNINTVDVMCRRARVFIERTFDVRKTTGTLERILLKNLDKKRSLC